MKAVAILVVLAAVTLTWTAPSMAEDVSTSEIIRKLNKPPKRSVFGMSDADHDFLRKIPKRGITLEDQQTYVKIVKTNSLPGVAIPVEFEFDSAVLDEPGHNQVKKLAKALADPSFAKCRFSLNGFTDAKGTPEHNQVLSEARAATVQKALVHEFGIPEDQLVAIGFGETMLKDEKHPEDAVNRRVEVIRLGDF